MVENAEIMKCGGWAVDGWVGLLLVCELWITGNGEDH